MGHLDIHQDDIRAQLARQFDGFQSVAGGADDLNEGFTIEHAHNTLAEQALIIGHHDTDMGSALLAESAAAGPSMHHFF
jgi:hypothetical protein